MMDLTLAEKERAFGIHKDSIVVDAHCDTLLDIIRGKRGLGSRSDIGHADIERLHAGGVGVQFFAAFIEGEYKPGFALKRSLQLIDVYHRELEINKNKIRHIQNYRDIEKAIRDEKLAAILSVEGGECLQSDLSVLRMLYRLGVRSICLTWNQRNEIADGTWERISGGGLTTFGRRTVREMNRLGMVIDLSHIAEKGFWDTIEVSEEPIIVSHANCREICNHPRNLTNEQISALAKKGGVLGITFAPEFIGAEANINHVLDHIDHTAKIAGTECIGLGSDFDGIESVPKGLEDASQYMNLTMGLVKRGYTDREIRGILGLNMLRVLKKVIR